MNEVTMEPLYPNTKPEPGNSTGKAMRDEPDGLKHVPQLLPDPTREAPSFSAVVRQRGEVHQKSLERHLSLIRETQHTLTRLMALLRKPTGS
jgi:hypothetical protein